MPPGGPGDPLPLPPSPRRRKSGLLVVIAAVGLLVIGVCLALVTNGGETKKASAPSPSGRWQVGQCVDAAAVDDSGSKGGVQQYNRVACDDRAARARIIKLASAAQIFDEVDCPDEADGAVDVQDYFNLSTSQTVCIRNLQAPHPGDPGVGGGIIRAGDCISYTGIFDGEVPCQKDDWYGKVVGRATAAAGCPAAQTIETFDVKGSSRPVICVGAGGKVLSPGDCIANPHDVLGTDLMTDMPEKETCGSSLAWAKITGRVARKSQCPAGSNRYLEQRGAYKPIMCVRTR